MKKLILISFLIIIIFSINIYSDEVYSEMNDEQMLMYIMYSNYDSLIELADYLQLDYEIGIEIEDLRKLLLDEFDFEIDQVLEQDSSVLIIKNSDMIDYYEIEEISTKYIKLLGNIYISIQGKIIKADKVIFDIEKKVVTAEGNIVFIDGKSVYYANKLYYNFDLKEGLIQSVKAKYDIYWINAEVVHSKGDNQFYAKNVQISTCNSQNPHYYVIGVDFYYSETYVLLLNANLYVGNTRLAWIPFYFSIEAGIGVPGIFGMNYGERKGLVLYNTFPLTENSLLCIDYFEKIGVNASIYTENKLFQNKMSYKFYFGGGYGSYLFYDYTRSLWSPYSNTYSVDKRQWDLRYGFYSEIDYRISSNLSMNLNVEFYSDMFFYYDYEISQIDNMLNTNDDKLRQFDLLDFLGNLGDIVYPSTKSLSNSFSLRYNYKKFSFNYNSDISVGYVIDNNEYRYSFDYYDYYVSAITPYSINSSLRYLSISNKYYSFSSSLSGYAREVLYYTEDKEIFRINKNYNIYNNFNFRLNFQYFSYSLYLKPRVNYLDYVNKEGENLVSDKKNSKFDFSLSNSISAGFDFAKISISSYQYYNFYLFKETEESLTVSSLRYSLGGAFFDRAIVYSFSSSLNLLEDDILKPIDYYINIKPTDYFYINYRSSLDSENNYTVNYHSISSRLNLTSFYIGNLVFSLSDSISYYNSLINIENHYINNSFSFSLSLEDEFSFSLSVVSKNNSLYKYNSMKEFYTDLLYSYNFFNKSDRLKSYFNLNSIRFSFKRDLHRFFWILGISGNYILDSTSNQYIFQTTYYFKISSLDINSLSFEEDYQTP